MELEGRLNQSISLPEVLQFLSMGKMTGRLMIVQENYSVTLLLKQGKLVNSSSLNRPRKIGQMLVSQQLVSRSIVEDALEHQQRAGVPLPLGQILVQRGYINSEQLKQAIRLQLEEEMWDLFSRNDGSFKFERGEEIELGDVIVELDIEPLIIEGTRRLDEWARIVRNIPSDEAIPSVVPLIDASDREMMQFSDNEWKVLSLVNGFYSIRSIANRSGVGRFETFRIINSFLASGQVNITIPNQTAELAPDDGFGDYDEKDPTAVPPTGKKDKGSTSSSRLNAILMGGRGENGNGGGSSSSRMSAPMEFESPASFMAGLATAIMKSLRDNPSFYIGAMDDRFAEMHWRAVVNDYPKADLVMAKGNIIDTTRFDRYVSVVGVEGPFRGCYDETLEALSRYLKTLYLAAAQRLGAKAAQTLFSQFFNEYRERSSIRHAEEFHFQEYASRIYA